MRAMRWWMALATGPCGWALHSKWCQLACVMPPLVRSNAIKRIAYTPQRTILARVEVLYDSSCYCRPLANSFRAWSNARLMTRFAIGEGFMRSTVTFSTFTISVSNGVASATAKVISNQVIFCLIRSLPLPNRIGQAQNACHVVEKGLVDGGGEGLWVAMVNA